MKARLALAAAATGVLTSACGASSHLPNPFAGNPLPHASLVSDKVDCLMGPETCSRYVVLRPVGETEEQLISQVRTFMVTRVGWKVERPQPKGDNLGLVYGGPTNTAGNDYGGYISSAARELATWQREHYTQGIEPPPTAEIAIQTAMQHTTNGVFVELLGSTCGSVQHCQGG